jgi:primosomal protein N' (replication factor Y)
VVLLYGVTGSGKTEVYLQAIDRVLKSGRGTVVLVPEISLTPQTVERFVGRFGERAAVLHSRLSDGERHDEWHRIREGKADIVIGARSAVFAPVRNLGLIVVDEEHENSYKQEDSPRYNARDVAVMRGHLEKCAVVLGSATPSLESWKNARTGKYKLSVLPRRADDRKMPVMRIVDMRLQSADEKKRGILSQDLVEAIRLRLERAEQVILFLNRRGFSSSLICPSCGFVASCENCSVSYTYHRTEEALICHLCGESRKVPQKCPGCMDPGFKYSGVGTQRVEATVRACFPHAKVQRMDADVTRRKHSHSSILGDFRSGKTDILIGTQMIAKGLHFPNVTLVGVVFADLSLHMPDFRAGERTFQLLAQVAGRAGRGEVSGEVIVQTFTPFHAAIQAARRLEFEGFCDQEMEFRKELTYPPFGHLACILVRGKSENKVSFCATALARALQKDKDAGVIAADAVPAPISRIRSEYRYQVILRSKSAGRMLKLIRQSMAEVRFPKDVACSIDMDALSLM